MQASYTYAANHRGDGRRLALAALVALLLHAGLILGLQLTSPAPPPDQPVLSLNIRLLKQAGGEPEPAPVQAASTAEVEPPAPVPEPPMPEPAPPPRPSSAPKPAPRPVVATPAPQAPLPKPGKPQPAPVQTALTKPAPPSAAAPTREDKPAPPKAPAPDREDKPAPAAPVTRAPAPRQDPPAQLSGLDLMERGLQMARLETAPRPQNGASRERHLNAQSMTDLEGFYLETWRRKVEQVGTLNFPAEARRLDRPSGPTLDVAIRADGTLHTVTLVRSSGHPALDAAARRIVELAAPYPPFPEALRREYDILHIVRRWKFEQGKLLGN